MHLGSRNYNAIQLKTLTLDSGTNGIFVLIQVSYVDVMSIVTVEKHITV